MFEQKMKSAIANSVRLGVEKGMDIEKAIQETLELAEAGSLPLDIKSNSPAIVKNFQFKAEDVDMENRIVEGYAATWDPDQVHDIIHRGAFKKSIKERMPDRIKVLSQHEVLIGKPIDMYEDEKGLYVKAFISNTTRGNDDLQLVKDGVLDRFSIGFSIPGGKYEIDEKGVRHIYEVKLMEFSLVTFPANEAAIVTGIKAEYDSEQESKKAEAEGEQAPEDAESTEATEGSEGADEGKNAEQDLELKELEDMFSSMKDFARLRLY